MQTVEERKKALADYLELNVDDIKQTDWNDNCFETPNGEEYLVLNYDEAVEETKNDIESCVYDLGVFGSFTPSFAKKVVNDYVDDDWFYDFFKEDFKNDIEYMVDEDLIEEAEWLDISVDRDNFDREDLEEEVLNAKMDNISNFVEEYVNYSGEDAFDHMIKENMDLLDLDGITEECIDLDGIAHFIARYDGEEIELNNDLYAYRTN